MDTTTTATRDIPAAVVEQLGHHHDEDGLRDFVRTVEAVANRGHYRGQLLPHGVQWLRVAAHGTEGVTSATAGVLDAAYTAGRVTFDREVPGTGCRITLAP